MWELLDYFHKLDRDERAGGAGQWPAACAERGLDSGHPARAPVMESCVMRWEANCQEHLTPTCCHLNCVQYTFKLMINHSSGKCVERKLWIRIRNVDWEAIVWHALINFHSHSLNSKQRVLETRDWSEECDTSVQWTEITTGFHSPDPLTVNSLNTVLVRLTEPVPGPQAPRGQC